MQQRELNWSGNTLSGVRGKAKHPGSKKGRTEAAEAIEQRPREWLRYANHVREQRKGWKRKEVEERKEG